MAQARSTTRTGDARIGSGARVRGRIHGDGDLLIEGQIEGDVAVRGDLTIAEGASVSSESVEAHAISIAGSLEAEVTASGPIRLEASAQVRGTLRGSAVAIADGARFSGRVDCEFELPPELGGGSRVESRVESRGRAPARR
jgi:cytoskeletal protein CcmA (bactofilin family)